MGLFRRKRRDDDGVVPDAGREARAASAASAHPARVAGFDGPVPVRPDGVTVLLVSRSDRHDRVPAMVVAARTAFGPEADVRAVAYVADASPVVPSPRGVPWVRPDAVEGIGSAVNAGVAGGVRRVLVVVDSTVGVTDQDLQVLAEAGWHGVVQARVWLSDGSARHGARLLRPGALPWSDDSASIGPGPDGLGPVVRSVRATDGPVQTVFAADQPALAMPGTALVPAPCLPDERTTLSVWTRAVADRTVRDVGLVWGLERSVEAGRTVDAATVDAVAAWRDRAVDGTGVVAAGPPLPPW
ncbi:MAG: hypothetical protein V4737_17180, partial [Curtobacterium sp.]